MSERKPYARRIATDEGRRFPKDIKPGERFGRLTVTGRTTRATVHTSFDYRCDCGRSGTAQGSALLDGRSRSCGCARGANIRSAWTEKLGHEPRRAVLEKKWNGRKPKRGAPVRRVSLDSKQMTSNYGDPIWRRAYPETRPPIRPGTRCRFCGEPPEEVFRNGTRLDREPLYAGREDRIVEVIDDTGDPHCPCVVKWQDGFVGIAERSWLCEVTA